MCHSTVEEYTAKKLHAEGENSFTLQDQQLSFSMAAPPMTQSSHTRPHILKFPKFPTLPHGRQSL